MKIIENKEVGSVTLEPEEGKRITDHQRSFYSKKLEINPECLELYTEVYYNENLNKEVKEKPSKLELTEEQKYQIDSIKYMIDQLNKQLEDILK